MNETTIVEYINGLKDLGIRIVCTDNDLDIKAPKGVMTKEIITELKLRKIDLIAYLSGGQVKENAVIPTISLQESYPISDAQRRLWILSQFENGSLAYNIPSSIYLNQSIDIECFKKAVNAVLNRHEILRTVFKADQQSEVKQWVLTTEELGFEITLEDYSQLSNGEELVQQYIASDSLVSFDLENGPLLRAALLQLTDDSYFFYYNMHHIISDGWSMEILSKDVFAYYEAFKLNQEPALEALQIQYKDYSVWQLAQVQGDAFQAHKKYWLNQLSGELPLLDLPSTLKRPQIKTNNGHGLGTFLDQDTTTKLKNYAQEQGGSLFIGLMAAWKLLMYRYTGQKDLLIGSPIAGRDQAGLEDQIGFYVNALALRNEVNPTESFNVLYQRIKEDTLQAYNHQMYPFDRLLIDLDLQRDTSRSPIFDVLLDYHNSLDQVQNVQLNAEEITAVSDRGDLLIKYDIEVHFEEIGNHISIQINFNSDCYEQVAIEKLLKHYKTLIGELCIHTNEPIGQINFLSESEQVNLLEEGNKTAVAYEQGKTTLDLFKAQVLKNPNAIALTGVTKTMSYIELDQLSNQLAHCLINKYAVKPTDLVGIKLDKSEWIIISIWAVLKTGAAYLPIDPEYPVARKAHIIAESEIELLITDTTYLFDEEEFNGAVFAVDVEFEEELYPTSEVNVTVTGDSLAYVIYTSGSTGKPKGVMIAHSALANYLNWAQATYQPNSSSQTNFGLFTSTAFDLTVTSLFLPLISGGELRLFDATSEISAVLKAYFESGLNSIKLTPAHVGVLKDLEITDSAIELAILGGDALQQSHIEILRNINPNMQIFNEYGPTESTVGCIMKEIGENATEIYIGAPIANTRIYILNEDDQIAPLGVVGEICIAGAGLAKGYLNQESLTAEKFVDNPYNVGEQIYKTGDLAKWLSNGNIDFVGRKDEQVKIKGYRIELAEIDLALKQFEAVNNSIVLAINNEQNEKELVAYLTAKEELNVTVVRSFLAERLPEYMLPTHFVQLDELPLTTNGKIDKKALPSPTGLGLKTGVEFIAPSTIQETVLVEVWTDVLKRDGIGIKDSFYNLGGDSIKSIQIVSRLRQKGYALKVEHILRTPILEELAKLIEETTRIIDQSVVTGEVELTPIQHWFFETDEIKVHSHFNQSILLKSETKFDVAILEKCFSALVEQHDVLRMIYETSDKGWKQINQDLTSKSYSFNSYDLSEAENPAEQMNTLGEELQTSFNLSEGPLFKIAHFSLEGSDRLALIAHHLLVDGVSWRILMEDLSSLYASYQANEKPILPLKTDAFQTWATELNAHAQSNKLDEERKYWNEISQQVITAIPQDADINLTTAPIDAGESFRLDKATTDLLQTQVHKVYNSEINDVLLTSLGLALKDVFSINKSVLKMEGHGREDLFEEVDIDRTVGWFTVMYPFVLDISEAKNKVESLVAVKESIRKVPNKGIGYGILKYLRDPKIEEELTPEIVFNYLGDFGGETSKKGESLFEYAGESIGSTIAKENENDAVLDISGMLVMGELNMSIGYSTLRFDEATIKGLIAAFEENLRFLINELSSKTDTYFTPSDLTFKGLSIEELSWINSDNSLEDVYELAPLQEGIYYHWMFQESKTQYFEQMSYRVHAKDLELDKLKLAYDALVARHGILRTSFTNDYAKKSLQIVRKEVASNFTFEKTENRADKEGYVRHIKQNDRELGFDLTDPSQMRMHIIDLSDGEYEFIWSHHHILMDGWCMSVLINDFNEILNSQATGSALSLPPALPYSNYINWLKTINKEKSLTYWKDYLVDYSEVAGIPFTARTKENSYTEATEYAEISCDVYNKVDTLCSEIGITQSTFIQAVWGYLLSRYNSTNDVVFGAVVSGRPPELQGVEEMIGLFINTIPVRVQCTVDDNPITFLKRMQEQSIESTPHHYLNLSEVQAQSEIGMNMINHIMIFDNYAVKEIENEGVMNSSKEEGLAVESMEVFEQSNYDLTLTVAPGDTALSVMLTYNSNRYDSEAIKQVKNHLENLINQFVQNTDKALHTLDYLSETEKHELLVSFNETKVDYADVTLLDLFQDQVVKTPSKTALVFENEKLTFQNLDEITNQLANYLQKNHAIQLDDLILVELTRSEWMVIAIMAILKAGGAYVPIDPELPQERIDYIEKDTNAKVKIDENELTKFRENQNAYSKEKVNSNITESNLAYVIYTSGSTGIPKGVMVEHGSISLHMQYVVNYYGVEEDENILLFTNLTFDPSTEQIFLSLITGASLHVISKMTLLDPDLFNAFIVENKITHLNATPKFLKTVHTEKFESLKRLVSGGEAFPNSRLEQWSKNVTFYNKYGPTEITIACTGYRHDENTELLTNVPIGKPVGNSNVYVIDEHDKLVPKGVIGQIIIGGRKVARGYLNEEELTNEKFMTSPFLEGERVYKTGDLGRWLPDGNLEFIGRRDDQVKIRGYRIELGEIEQVLSANEDINEVVVMALESKTAGVSDLHGEKEIVAYITAEEDQDVSGLRAYLKERLPEFMLPSYFVQLDKIPLTIQGKIDRKALPSPEGLGLKTAVEYVAPRNEIEETLVEVWKLVLGRKKIGVFDDFFEIGGHSLRAMGLVVEYKNSFNVGLSLQDIYDKAQIAAHAELIEIKNWIKDEPVEEAIKEDNLETFDF
ncbi:MAG: amino acid adenylation domain-containing protein [Crocinitomix sp.]|jgi:amino acid adenylation domain-containing protein/non-ribosomal peptide synthase protein (TIGR01720 family)